MKTIKIRRSNDYYSAIKYLRDLAEEIAGNQTIVIFEPECHIVEKTYTQIKEKIVKLLNSPNIKERKLKGYEVESTELDRDIAIAYFLAAKQKEKDTELSKGISKGSQLTEKELNSFSSVVYDISKAPRIIQKIKEKMEGKTNPKDILMPIRAAMDAGIIRRPKWRQFCSVFGEDIIKSKSSLTYYTDERKDNVYYGQFYDNMVEDFKKLKEE